MSRILPGRVKRRKASKGRHFRVSDLVYATLDKQRHGRSWDAALRVMLGLPDRAGRPQPLVEGVLEVHTGTFILKASPEVSWEETEEIALRLAKRAEFKKLLRYTDKPVRLREVR